MATDLTVANTILAQLGGRHFRVMTGAKYFTGEDNALMFGLPGGGGFCKNGINRVKITLTPMDVYTVQFYRVRGTDSKLISEHTDIFAENLRELFERETGLRTRL